MRETGRRVRRAASSARAMGEVERRERLLERIERITEPILLLMAFVMVPLIVGPFLWDLSSQEVTEFALVSTFIWVAFAVEFGAKLLVAPLRMRYLKQHWIEGAIVVVPFFRPLYLVRFLLVGSRAILGLRQLAQIDFVLVLSAGVVIIGATVMYSIDTTNAGISSFGDALWWSIVTVTTVGYGDIVPSSTGGRVVSFFVMFGGIALFGAVAGNVAALLARVTRNGRSNHENPFTKTDELLAEIRQLREDVRILQQSVAAPQDPSA